MSLFRVESFLVGCVVLWAATTQAKTPPLTVSEAKWLAGKWRTVGAAPPALKALQEWKVSSFGLTLYFEGQRECNPILTRSGERRWKATGCGVVAFAVNPQAVAPATGFVTLQGGERVEIRRVKELAPDRTREAADTSKRLADALVAAHARGVRLQTLPLT